MGPPGKPRGLGDQPSAARRLQKLVALQRVTTAILVAVQHWVVVTGKLLVGNCRDDQLRGCQVKQLSDQCETNASPRNRGNEATVAVTGLGRRRISDLWRRDRADVVQILPRNPEALSRLGPYSARGPILHTDGLAWQTWASVHSLFTDGLCGFGAD